MTLKQSENTETTLQNFELAKFSSRGGVLDLQVANDIAYQQLFEDSPQNLLLDRMILLQFHKVEREM